MKGDGGGVGFKALRPRGQQPAATPPLSGKICIAVLRLERHSRCTAPYPEVNHRISKRKKKRKKRGGSGKDKVRLPSYEKKNKLHKQAWKCCHVNL